MHDTHNLRTRIGGLARSVRGHYAGIRLLLDPNRLGDVFELDEAFFSEERAQKVVESLRLHGTSEAALRERPRVGRIDLGALRALPEGTLGRVFAAFMDERGLRPEAIPTRAHHDELSYARAHLYETHDIWHVVTGFDTDVAGELAVQAVYLAQFHGNLPPLILAGGLLNSALFAPSEYVARIEAIIEGYRVGKEAKPLFGVRWNELWPAPLAEVRRDLGVVPAS